MSNNVIQEDDRRGAHSMIFSDANEAHWEFFDKRAFECRVLICPEDDGGFSAHAIRLPGVVTQGDTIEEALENIRDAFQSVVQCYLAEGASIPWCDNASIERTKESLERWIVVNV